MPPAIMDFMGKNHKGEKISETAKITKRKNGEIEYEVGTKKKDILFDAAGKPLK